LSAYSWQQPTATGGVVQSGGFISADPIIEMRTALDQALGAPSPAYATGLAQGQPVRTIHIQELRDRVLAAWNSSTGAVDINWLVADQLGTPRMIFDKTGSLANTKRHDYLPFGEELIAGQGARTPGLGYAADSVRQKFTRYERDIETSLDYAQARYYSSVQGRFTSIDPLMASASIGDPQSFNRSSYVLNNPVNSTDPTGRCPKGKKCYTDTAPNGEVTEYYDDEDGNTVLVGPSANAKAPSMFPLIVGALGVGTSADFQVVYRSSIVLRGTAAAPAASAGPSIFGKMLGAFGLILSNPISIGCGQTPNTVSDGSGGCMHVDPDPDKSANPDPEDNKPDTSENKTERDKEKSRESKENYRPLSKKDIKELQNRGYDIHELKEGMGRPSHADLYKDRNGNVYVMGKSGKGQAESTGVKLN
jgi:RHS repeat-associated protein